MFGVSAMIDMLVPDIPHELEEVMKREKYLAEQALSDHHHLMGSSDDNLDDVSVSIAWHEFHPYFPALGKPTVRSCITGV